MPPSLPNGVPRYIIDLDLPPIERYRQIIADHKAHLGAVNDFVDTMAKELAPTAGAFVLKCVQGVLNLSNKLSVVYYNEELPAIAELSGMPLGRIVMMQLIYEASALCTSVIVPMSRAGQCGHIRTMDWEMDFLKALTIEVELRRGGRTHAIATTWAGYCGILTGVAVREDQPRDGFSVSVNFRSVGSGTFATNLKCALTRAWPIGFLVRETLMRADNYATAVSWLTNSRLIAPCYFTVCGAAPWKGTLITRCRSESAKPLSIANPNSTMMGSPLTAESPHAKKAKKAKRARDASNGGVKEDPPTAAATAVTCTIASCLVQPNMDHWSNEADDDILWSIRRRRDGRELMGSLMAEYGVYDVSEVGGDDDDDNASSREPHTQHIPPPSIPPSALWDAMSHPPIMNSITIYGTYMNPLMGTLETRLPREGPDGYTKVF